MYVGHGGPARGQARKLRLCYGGRRQTSTSQGNSKAHRAALQRSKLTLAATSLSVLSLPKGRPPAQPLMGLEDRTSKFNPSRIRAWMSRSDMNPALPE